MEVVLAVLRDVIGRFEITRKEDLKVPPVGYFFFHFFFLKFVLFWSLRRFTVVSRTC